jgi:hypothetical protein
MRERERGKKKKKVIQLINQPDQVGAREGSKTHRFELRPILLPWLCLSMMATSAAPHTYIIEYI